MQWQCNIDADARTGNHRNGNLIHSHHISQIISYPRSERMPRPVLFPIYACNQIHWPWAKANSTVSKCNNKTPCGSPLANPDPYIWSEYGKVGQTTNKRKRKNKKEKKNPYILVLLATGGGRHALPQSDFS